MSLDLIIALAVLMAGQKKDKISMVKSQVNEKQGKI